MEAIFYKSHPQQNTNRPGLISHSTGLFYAPYDVMMYKTCKQDVYMLFKIVGFVILFIFIVNNAERNIGNILNRKFNGKILKK